MGYLKMSDGQIFRVGAVDSPMECFRCGICCVEHQAILTDEDIQRLAENLKMSRDEFVSSCVQATLAGYLLRHTRDGCIFLEWDDGKTRASCAVYPFRPECCSAWVPSFSRKECREGLYRLKANTP